VSLAFAGILPVDRKKLIQLCHVQNAQAPFGTDQNAFGSCLNRRNFRQDTMMIGICEDVATEVSIIEALPFGESLP